MSPSRSTGSCSGPRGAPESTNNPVQPSRSATRKALEKQSGCMLLSTITAGTLPPQITTRRGNGRSDGTNDDDHQGEVLEAAQPCGEALRDTRLLVRAAARAAPEREAGRCRRGHGQEASAVADSDPRAERRQARFAGPPGCLAGTRGSRPPGARA